MESPKKFNDLAVGNTYVVQGYSDPINSQYGISYILKISELNSSVSFDMFSTNMIAEYISKSRPSNKFTFTVNERNNKKYPVIDGYKKERKFRMLN